jgi:acetoacetyl-CoA synthetase
MADSQSVLLWENQDPTSTFMWDFINVINTKYGQHIKTYRELHKWSIENISDFWGETWAFTSVKATPFKQVSRNFFTLA